MVQAMPECREAVRVYDPYSDEVVELVPVKVWVMNQKTGVKIGLFAVEAGGRKRYFRARVPPEYPVCG